ncbi:16S rRNA (cytosine(1402)-N(4))-methyltransferase RsmH [Thiorhodovibrio frisius]|uniref:Ribosomal RNA small subunit methyltransferase H n=2 Tax=Thiorhodovibrio frisius TaxID=631362 RepID=H8Z3J1_9GAMM|nr:16S rRNA (cytosine(1402)-N(4))-methyltransferase RsmH [Thiorhodovibrio frisius]EIC21899.1 S-adenosyl-methyltransferase MraW [Thiorhodovibrio frisius]WPL24188.1 Ribosomal RNA small subunit methyltransferase H [Thiorhodovibrio frisius]
MGPTGCDHPGGGTALGNAQHCPVLVEETMHALAINPAATYVDATFGRGGHARALLERLGPDGRLLAFDRDPEAIGAGEALQQRDCRLQISHCRLSETPARLKEMGLQGRIAGFLLDLGVSSPQLDTPARGFSFNQDGPLDMRMDPSQGEPLSAWLAGAPVAEIVRVLKDYGEERYAARIARAIERERAQRALTTTGALAGLIERSVPTREPGKHPATRSFQALRIVINQELDELRACLAGVTELLAAGGRLVVISFHSLEDRIVKRFIRDQARGPVLPKSVPVRAAASSGLLRSLGGALRPGESEIATNPRARSAILRVAERRS